MQSKNAFTLLEISLALALLGLLVAIAVPKLSAFAEAARVSNDILALNAVNTAVEAEAVDDELPNAYKRTAENRITYRIRLAFVSNSSRFNPSNYTNEIQAAILRAVHSNAGDAYIELSDGTPPELAKSAIFQSKLLHKKAPSLMVIFTIENGFPKICTIATPSFGNDDIVFIPTYRSKPVAIGDIPQNAEVWNDVTFTYFALEH
jgi:prepilin-type N-terminal cleavage/methylation domain-containing protein